MYNVYRVKIDLKMSLSQLVNAFKIHKTFISKILITDVAKWLNTFSLPGFHVKSVKEKPSRSKMQICWQIGVPRLMLSAAIRDCNAGNIQFVREINIQELQIIGQHRTFFNSTFKFARL